MTNYVLLSGKRIVNVHDGRPDGSVLVRLDDRTEIVIREATILHGDDTFEIKGPNTDCGYSCYCDECDCTD